MTRLDRLLRPRHIAVLGAGWALNVIEQCRKMGFAGPVWPVHPTKAEIGGLKAYASLADLPEPPDATFIGVNRFATLEVVAELAAMGAGGAICFASGWEEAGEAGLQEKLVAAAGDMPILGPNCYGVINYLDGALLWPDQHGGVRLDKGVALVSQSSNIVINLGMQARGLPVAYVACLGNAAVVGLAELTGALLDDPRVTAVGLYIEGIDDAPAFAALAEKARAMGKGVVAIKSGKTELSRTAAASHTASLAGGGAASSAFLRQIGVAEVNSPSELIETLKIFHVHGPQIGTRLCSLSCSGGEAGLEPGSSSADPNEDHGRGHQEVSSLQLYIRCGKGGIPPCGEAMTLPGYPVFSMVGHSWTIRERRAEYRMGRVGRVAACRMETNQICKSLVCARKSKKTLPIHCSIYHDEQTSQPDKPVSNLLIGDCCQSPSIYIVSLQRKARE